MKVSSPRLTGDELCCVGVEGCWSIKDLTIEHGVFVRTELVLYSPHDVPILHVSGVLFDAEHCILEVIFGINANCASSIEAESVVLSNCSIMNEPSRQQVERLVRNPISRYLSCVYWQGVVLYDIAAADAVNGSITGSDLSAPFPTFLSLRANL